jgi:hypothetical protein
MALKEQQQIVPSARPRRPGHGQTVVIAQAHGSRTGIASGPAQVQSKSVCQGSCLPNKN